MRRAAAAPRRPWILCAPWLATLGACAPPASIPPGAVSFDSATVWIRHGADSTRVVIEVAASRAQHEAGLAGRPSLDPDSGMLFVFDPPRSADEGFWMWRTRVPLDIAFIDGDGVIIGILRMDPCSAATQDDCPGYFAEAGYASALEMTRGWFSRYGIEPGSSVRVGG